MTLLHFNSIFTVPGWDMDVPILTGVGDLDIGIALGAGGEPYIAAKGKSLRRKHFLIQTILAVHTQYYSTNFLI